MIDWFYFIFYVAMALVSFLFPLYQRYPKNATTKQTIVRHWYCYVFGLILLVLSVPVGYYSDEVVVVDSIREFSETSGGGFLITSVSTYHLAVINEEHKIVVDFPEQLEVGDKFCVRHQFWEDVRGRKNICSWDNCCEGMKLN